MSCGARIGSSESQSGRISRRKKWVTGAGGVPILCARGRSQRAEAACKDERIRVLTGALEDAVDLIRGTSAEKKCDTVFDRLLCLLPGVESAFDGRGGRIAHSGCRAKRNQASHAEP